MAELKPCPFCGGKPYIGRCFGSSQRNRYSVKCRCGVLTQFFDRRYKAIEAWNRRAEDGK